VVVEPKIEDIPEPKSSLRENLKKHFLQMVEDKQLDEGY